MTQFAAIDGPVVEPVTLAETKKHLRVDSDLQEEDALIEDCIIAARLSLEDKYKIRLVTQTVELRMDYFGEQQDHTSYGWWGWNSLYSYRGIWGWPWWNAIEVQPPLQSVTSIQYYDPENQLQTFPADSYDTARKQSNPAFIFPLPGKQWPLTAPRPDAVIVTYVAGWTDPKKVPLDIKQALKLLIGHFYNNREQFVLGTVRTKAVEMPWGVDALMANYGRDMIA